MIVKKGEGEVEGGHCVKEGIFGESCDVLRAKNRSSESIATALTRRITTVAEVSNV